MNIGTLTVTLMADLTSLDKMTTGLNTMAQRFRTFGYLASTALTLPMVMAGKASFQMAKDYEFSMQKIVGLTGVAQDAVNKWSDEILKLGPQLGKTPQELADALYFILSSGIKGAEAMNVLILSAKAAESGLGETADVANVLTSALNAYRGTGLTAAYATDVFIAAIREGKAEASAFVTAIGQLIPIAANAGVSFDQMAGGMAAITLTGSSAANAAVYLKGVFNTLITANKQGSKALENVGISYAYLRKVLADGPNGLINVMQIFRDVQMKLGDEAIKDVIPNIRAMGAFMSIAGKNFEYNTELMKRVTNATGSLSAAMAAVANTIKVRFDQAISQANVSLITLGKSVATSFLPLLENLVQKLDRLTKWFESLTEAQKENRLKWLAFIAILGPVTLIISVIAYSISGLISILGGLWATLKYGRLIILAWTGSMEAATAAGAMNATLTIGLLNPLGLVLIAVAALAAAYFILKNRMEAATDAGEHFKKLQETGKYIQSTEKGFQDKVGLIPDMNASQLDTFRNEANQKLVILQDVRLQLTTLRKKWQEEDKTYLNLQKDLAFNEAALTKWQGKGKGWNQAVTVAEFATNVKNDKEAIEKYILAYNIGLDKTTTTLDTKIKTVEGTIKTINDTIKALPVDPILAQLEQETRVAEVLKIRNTEIAKIIQNEQDELKYTDSLTIVMRTLGIEYDSASSKVDIFLKAIQDLTKEGLGPNSKEIQDQIKLIQDFRKELETANPSIKKLGGPTFGENGGNFPALTKPIGYSIPPDKLAGIGMTLGGEWKTNPEDIKKYIAWLQTAAETEERLGRIARATASAITGLGTALGEIAAGSQGAMKGMVTSILQGLNEIVQAYMAVAIAATIAKNAALPFGLIFAAIGIAALTAFWQAAVPSFANGGTVPPGFPNDSYPARLTSGETVLPKALSGAVLNNQMSGEVVFTIAGTTLVGVLKNQNRRTNSFA